MFEPVEDALARRRRLIIPDLRGSGQSRHLPPPFSAKQQAQDLAQLLDRLDISSADMIADQDRDLMIPTWKEAMAFDSRARLKEINCPTLIIAGANDNAVPMHHPAMLHEGIKGSKLVVIEQADHAMIWTYPERLVPEVEAFLV